MTILRLIAIFTILLNFLHFDVFAQNEIKWNASFEIYLYMEKYTFADNEPIMLYINIKNKSLTKNSFKIYDADYTSFRPVVYDMDGKEAETLVEYRLKNNTLAETVKDSAFRVIELSQNETFTHTIDLASIYKIIPEKEYRIKALFSSNAENQASAISYNQLTMKIVKSVNEAGQSGISRIAKFSSPARSLSAFEVVMLFLKAEKDRNWDNYFKYIDIEKFIKAYPDYVKIYNQAVKKNDFEQKEKIIIDFVNFLKIQRSDYIVNYDVQNELKSSDKSSYVYALVKRFAAGNPVYYRYRYSLEKYENLWLITDVEVTVSKGQKI
jgi:hypothetical protein